MHHILGTNSLWRRLRKFCQWNIAWLADSQRSIAEFLVQYWHQEVMVSGSNVPSLGSHHGGAVGKALGRHLEKSKNRHISAAFRPISTKFGTVAHLDPLELLDH